MEEFLVTHGYLSLFTLSFLASTIIPLGSEWLLLALLFNGHNPAMSVAVATAGNTLGACTTYWIGLWGSPFVTSRILRMNDQEQQKAARLYTRYGAWTLLLSWLPVIGDPLCLISGIAHTRFAKFFILVFSGKLARYIAVSLIAQKIISG